MTKRKIAAAVIEAAALAVVFMGGMIVGRGATGWWWPFLAGVTFSSVGVFVERLRRPVCDYKAAAAQLALLTVFNPHRTDYWSRAETEANARAVVQAALTGEVFAARLPPHPNCRCTTLPVGE